MSVDERTRRRTPIWFAWWMIVVIGVTAILCLVQFWVIASRGTETAEVVLWALLGVAGVLALLFGLIGLFRYRAFRLSLAAPLLLGLLGAAVYYDIPERAAWKLSRGILEEQAADCVNPGQRTRLGVYSIRYIDRKDGGCLFYFEGEEKNAEGFGYFPDTPPPALGYEAYHIPWYRFVDNS